ncbi:MAG: hypothetical protein ACTSV5_11340 [Promethearchaeota archaeon]
MKTVKYGLEITFPDEDIADVNLIQRVLFEAPEFNDCLVNVYIDNPKNEASRETIDIERLTKKAKACPSCNGRELHLFYVDKETLLDIYLPKECENHWNEKIKKKFAPHSGDLVNL